MSTREYREKHRAAGLCRSCTFPVFKGGRCFQHYQSHQNTQKKKHIAACCGELGRIEVEYARMLITVAKSELATELDRAAARRKLEAMMSVMPPEGRENFERGLIIMLGAKEPKARKAG